MRGRTSTPSTMTFTGSSAMRDEYDFSPEQLRSVIRGKYAARFGEGVNLVPIDPDLAEVFPDAEAVNRALRAMASVIRARESDKTAQQHYSRIDEEAVHTGRLFASGATWCRGRRCCRRGP
jgi:hypothetical protein